MLKYKFFPVTCHLSKYFQVQIWLLNLRFWEFLKF